jgi:hypothetical protein
VQVQGKPVAMRIMKGTGYAAGMKRMLEGEAAEPALGEQHLSSLEQIASIHDTPDQRYDTMKSGGANNLEHAPGALKTKITNRIGKSKAVSTVTVFFLPTRLNSIINDHDATWQMARDGGHDAIVRAHGDVMGGASAAKQSGLTSKLNQRIVPPPPPVVLAEEPKPEVVAPTPPPPIVKPMVDSSSSSNSVSSPPPPTPAMSGVVEAEHKHAPSGGAKKGSKKQVWVKKDTGATGKK